MPIHDDLGKRMKENYENISKNRLVRRMPVAIRIDGKAFHTFTRGFSKPYDRFLISAMQKTTKFLCKNIQGCVFGYTQSDEISLILIDYAKIESCAWLNNETQKICSITASMATMIFNKIWNEQIREAEELQKEVELGTNSIEDLITFSDKYYMKDEYYMKDLEDDWTEVFDHMPTYKKVAGTAMFDARCFNIPKEEVTNLIYWRQLDATRNSIQMVAQSQFPHKEIQGLSCNKLQDKLLTEKNINWNNYPTAIKRGSACIKDSKGKWFIDTEMPILKGIDRNYIDKLIFIGE